MGKSQNENDGATEWIVKLCDERSPQNWQYHHDIFRHCRFQVSPQVSEKAARSSIQWNQHYQSDHKVKEQRRFFSSTGRQGQGEDDSVVYGIGKTGRYNLESERSGRFILKDVWKSYSGLGTKTGQFLKEPINNFPDNIQRYWCPERIGRQAHEHTAIDIIETILEPELWTFTVKPKETDSITEDISMCLYNKWFMNQTQDHFTQDFTLTFWEPTFTHGSQSASLSASLTAGRERLVF